MEELKNTLLHSVTGHAWKTIGVQPHHGINILLSSLHSENSCGIGEFFDLLPIIDWCQRLKMDVIQLLPLNSSEGDPSPYNAISSCGLNIIYLSLYALPHLEKHPHLKKSLKEFSKLNTTNRVAYLEVFTHKMTWLHAYFDAVGDKIIKSKELQNYISENPWVEHYALYKALTSRLGGAPSESWPREARFPTSKEFKALLERYDADVCFYIALQYLSFIQLKEVKEYAHQRGVFLMGDFPILLSEESVDVWQYPDFFIHNLEAGAPPDFYNKEGQNWGFPIYAWEPIRKKHFSWWKHRLKYAENFFSIIRLDHVQGFFRIWAIPPGQPSKEGHFVPLDEKEWESQGREILSMISASTHMLPIAEDLGTVPDIIRPCLKEMGICSTKVMRWERKWDEDNRYIPIQYYQPISLTTLSTHDSETLLLWWKKYTDEARDYADYKHWTYAPELTEIQREEILWDSHHTSSLFHINLFQEYLALFPDLIWPSAEDERINVPGKVLPTNWTYRLRPSVEEITSHKGLFAKMEKILFSPSSPSLS